MKRCHCNLHDVVTSAADFNRDDTYEGIPQDCERDARLLQLLSEHEMDKYIPREAYAVAIMLFSLLENERKNNTQT